MGIPVLFASLCFALRFRARASPDLAFGWNLLGAVVGGLTEMLSMAWGLKALLLVAGGAYVTSYFVSGSAANQTPLPSRTSSPPWSPSRSP